MNVSELTDEQLSAYYQLYKKGMEKSGRFESAKINGMDSKFLYHLVRLACECEQILTTGELDLQRDRELYKAIRRGEWTLEKLEEWFGEKEKELEKLYHARPDHLPWGPDEDAIKTVLMSCLEAHYGSLDKCVNVEDEAVKALREIREVMDKYRHLSGTLNSEK